MQSACDISCKTIGRMQRAHVSKQQSGLIVGFPIYLYESLRLASNRFPSGSQSAGRNHSTQERYDSKLALRLFYLSIFYLLWIHVLIRALIAVIKLILIVITGFRRFTDEHPVGDDGAAGLLHEDLGDWTDAVGSYVEPLSEPVLIHAFT